MPNSARIALIMADSTTHTTHRMHPGVAQHSVYTIFWLKGLTASISFIFKPIVATNFLIKPQLV